jgi:hypothetical protein
LRTLEQSRAQPSAIFFGSISSDFGQSTTFQRLNLLTHESKGSSHFPITPTDFPGLLLFLLGLLVGLAAPVLANPRMGVSSHIEGVLNGNV